jgi:6-phosphogluconolactonase
MRTEIIDPIHFASEVADELIAIFDEVLSEKPRCSVALCGGSTPGEVYRALSLPPRSTSIKWDKIDFFLGDERFVPHTDDRSNYLMVQQTMIHNLTGVKPQVYPVNDKCSNVQQAANEYQTLIKKVIPCNAEGIPSFDIILLGIGEDGHTASLFPNDNAVNDHSAICLPVNHPTDGTQRVTFSVDLITAANRIMYLVKGKSKAQIAKTIVTGNDSIMHYPARLFTKVSDKTSFFLDSMAASLLHS